MSSDSDLRGLAERDQMRERVECPSGCGMVVPVPKMSADGGICPKCCVVIGPERTPTHGDKP